MTDRDRLIELLKGADNNASQKLIMDYDDAIADNADYLLANGVIVPPCKVGDTVYCIDSVVDMKTFKSKPIIIPRVISEIKLNYTIMSNGMLLFESRFGHSIFHDVNKAEEKLKECEKDANRYRG
jgi:hypothetical protein